MSLRPLLSSLFHRNLKLIKVINSFPKVTELVVGRSKIDPRLSGPGVSLCKCCTFQQTMVYLTNSYPDNAENAEKLLTLDTPHS